MGGLEPGPARGADWPGRRRLEKVVGVSLIVSGSVHGLVAPEHFSEWWGYGVFFTVAAIALITLGLALITEAIDPRYMPGDVERLRRLMYGIGWAGNAAVLLLYVLTRTVGIPLGPQAGIVEIVGLPDVVAKAAECVALVGLAALLIRTRPAGSRLGGRRSPTR